MKDETLVVLEGAEYEVVGEARQEIVPKWSRPEPKTIPVLYQGWVGREVYEKHPDTYDVDPAGNPFGADDGGRFCVSLEGKSVQLRTGDRVIVVRPKAKR